MFNAVKSEVYLLLNLFSDAKLDRSKLDESKRDKKVVPNQVKSKHAEWQVSSLASNCILIEGSFEETTHFFH